MLTMALRLGMYWMAIFKIRLEPESTGYQTNSPASNSVKLSQLTVIQYEPKIRTTTKMFNVHST